MENRYSSTNKLPLCGITTTHRLLGPVSDSRITYHAVSSPRKPAFGGFSKDVGVTILEQFQRIRYVAAMMKLFYVFFFFSCILAGVLSFRGGHGRPLYGKIV
ncbi:hypothetical protein Y032_0023g844 [Ancylostoma ceylanicum]|uniref:Uncharacterized protein n=1 Tax=Ancylostoma ceylanicum TaxID=53326 RepID=A0A016UYJ6_9BILA|nr:hypothetical protein Y032_0023g844 [Ancylostoma ceylanicum]